MSQQALVTYIQQLQTQNRGFDLIPAGRFINQSIAQVPTSGTTLSFTIAVVPPGVLGLYPDTRLKVRINKLEIWQQGTVLSAVYTNHTITNIQTQAWGYETDTDNTVVNTDFPVNFPLITGNFARQKLGELVPDPRPDTWRFTGLGGSFSVVLTFASAFPSTPIGNRFRIMTVADLSFNWST